MSDISRVNVDGSDYGVNGQIKDDLKQALLGLADAVGYKDDTVGASAKQALYNALYSSALTSISASFNAGSNTVYANDSLDNLKQYLTVTANYENGTHGTVTSYTLSGSLSVGSNTITVTYQGKTTTFTVTAVNDLWYSVSNHVCDGTSETILDTQIALSDEDRDFTEVLTVVTSESQGSSRTYRIIGNVQNVDDVLRGVALVKYSSSGGTNFRWNNAQETFSDFKYNTIGTSRFVIRHKKGSGNATLDYKVTNGTANKLTVESDFYPSAQTVHIGGNPDGTNTFLGTISCSIYHRAWTDDEVSAFLTGA